MTAEIALMNRSAVALAADSAVTIQSDGKVKIYNTHKLFTLSKHQPVGIMIYGSAGLTGVPWEPVIKTYRSNLGDRSFGTLNEYAEDFVRFLDGNNPVFPESEQRKRFGVWAAYYLNVTIRKSIDERVKEIDSQGSKVSEKELKALVSERVREVYDGFESLNLMAHLPSDFLESLVRNYKNTIDDAIKRVFQKIPLTATLLKKLRYISASLFAKQHWIDPDQSGVVIAGFGDDEIFPAITSIFMGGIANGRLKYEVFDQDKITTDESSNILAFAQREMVVSFMEGIDPRFQSTLESYLSALFDQYPEILANSVTQLSDTQKKNYAEKWKEVGKRVVEEILKQLGEYKRTNHVNPIISTVGVLPKDELAAMAESLVNLTSLKRKFTMDAETVGGPIDVAVISKGDGFIWIKRKHYFEASSNPQFFANYYGRTRVEETQ